MERKFSIFSGIVSNPLDRQKDAQHAKRINWFVIPLSLIATLILVFL